jgi:hypothetical protein
MSDVVRLGKESYVNPKTLYIHDDKSYGMWWMAWNHGLYIIKENCHNVHLGSTSLHTLKDDQLFFSSSYVLIWFPIVCYL